MILKKKGAFRLLFSLGFRTQNAERRTQDPGARSQEKNNWELLIEY
jgi:hypothetical protein